MDFMPWSDAFAVGHDEVDEQHRWLFETTNRLHRAQSADQVDHATLLVILEGLVDYTMNHFIMEEELFQRFAYPKAREHKALHDRFSERVMQQLMACERGENIGPEVLEMLRAWLQHHILVDDKAYVPFVKAAMASASD